MRPATLLAALAIGVITTPALAGDLYKCVNAAGKVEFQDRPCDAKSTTQKIDVKPNSVGTMEPGEASKKLEALNKKIADRNKAEDIQRAQAELADAQFFELCRGYAEEIYKQQPLTYHGSAATRASAERAIGVQRRRMSDAGCPPVNVRAIVNGQ